MAPTGPVWSKLFGLPLVRRMSQARFAADFPRLRRLVDIAIEDLSIAYETRPVYTLHGVWHAVDTVRRVGELLGTAVQELTGNEIQLLILGAFFHDVGRSPAAGPPPQTGRIAAYLDEHGPHY